MLHRSNSSRFRCDAAKNVRRLLKLGRQPALGWRSGEYEIRRALDLLFSGF